MKITASAASKSCESKTRLHATLKTAILLKYCYFNQSHELKIVWVHVCNQGMTMCNEFSGQVMKINPFHAQKMPSMATTHLYRVLYQN